MAVDFELRQILEHLFDLAHVGLAIHGGVGEHPEAAGLGRADAFDRGFEDAFALDREIVRLAQSVEVDVPEEADVGLVAMKPFAGGTLLRGSASVFTDSLSSGWRSFHRKEAISATPIQCISYVLSQAGVSTVVPGVKSTAELQETLRFLNAGAEEKSFDSLVENVGSYLEGGCVYCNHCLPCPSSIDIARVNRLVDTSKHAFTANLYTEYNELSAKASDCTECEACMKRCPFHVDVISHMKEAKRLFEGIRYKAWIRSIYWRLHKYPLFWFVFRTLRELKRSFLNAR